MTKNTFLLIPSLSRHTPTSLDLWIVIHVLVHLRAPLVEGTMTQNVTSESIAHPDKTRGLENMTVAKTILEKNVPRAGAEKGEVIVEKRALGARTEALKDKGSQYLVLILPL